MSPSVFALQYTLVTLILVQPKVQLLCGKQSAVKSLHDTGVAEVVVVLWIKPAGDSSPYLQ